MEEEISLSELFAILKRHLSKIIIWSLIGIILSGVYTFFFVTPQYQSTSKIVVNQTQNTSQTITNTDIQTNLNLINTYQSIIKEPIILEDIVKAADSDLTLGKLRDKITIQTQNNSLVFGITVTDEDAYQAANLSNAIASSFESKIGDILDVQSVTILSEAVPNTKPVSPNIPMNLAIGLILGMMLGVGISFLQEYLDNTVKSSQFINENIGWTDLGSISMMTEKEKKEVAKASRSELAVNSRRRV